MKKELRRLMGKYFILSCELDDVLHFVHDLLVQKAKMLEQTEPYATITIKSLYDAAHEVDGIEYDIEEMMEDDEDESKD